MAGFRSEEMEERYALHKKNGGIDRATFTFDIENEAIEHFKFWALLPCPFYYDLIAEEHHMLIPKRVFGSFTEMSAIEFEELKQIKLQIGPRYSFVLENLPSRISVPTHYHLHFIKAKTAPGLTNNQ